MVDVKSTYTTQEAALRLEVTTTRVRQMIAEGLLQTRRFGRAHVITAEALEFAAHRKTTPGPAPKAKAEALPSGNTPKRVAKTTAKKGGAK